MAKTKKTPKTEQDPFRWKAVEEMTAAEVVNEAENLSYYAQGCREIGQGINSKEVIRFNGCINRIEKERLTNPSHLVEIRVRWDERLSGGRDLLFRLYQSGGTLEAMQKLFAPI